MKRLRRAERAGAYGGAEHRARRRAWSTRNPGNVAARAELSQALLEAAADRIAAREDALDVGCGTGWLLEALAGTGAQPRKLHGVELDRTRANGARARVPGAAITNDDARAMRFSDGMFGVVFLIVVLSSLEPPGAQAALAEARRVLSPGGTLLVYEPRIPNPLNRGTHVVRRSDFDQAGIMPRTERSLTLLPQIGRHLGPLTPALHSRLSRVSALRSHRLITYRAPAS